MISNDGSEVMTVFGRLREWVQCGGVYSAVDLSVVSIEASNSHTTKIRLVRRAKLVKMEALIIAVEALITFTPPYWCRCFYTAHYRTGVYSN